MYLPGSVIATILTFTALTAAYPNFGSDDHSIGIYAREAYPEAYAEAYPMEPEAGTHHHRHHKQLFPQLNKDITARDERRPRPIINQQQAAAPALPPHDAQFACNNPNPAFYLHCAVAVHCHCQTGAVACNNPAGLPQATVQACVNQCHCNGPQAIVQGNTAAKKGAKKPKREAYPEAWADAYVEYED
ncbi:hypothetical protein MMC18_002143 [Xylographa bjoerkii]|nr:hypothetical protein [Xylographa bjoerkii]